MRWELITASDFKSKTEESKGVCVLPMGVMERHGDHLPVGTDFLSAYMVATRAAELEPSIVFPPFYFGMIGEAKCFPGTLATSPEATDAILQSVLEEIGRNGLNKIIIYNAHGGSWSWLRYLIERQRYVRKDYMLYLYLNHYPQGINELLETGNTHGGEGETSIIMTKYEKYVKMENVPEGFTGPQGRLAHIPNTMTSMSWYSDYPQHYSGDARSASAEKGEKMIKLMSADLASYIKKVKEDSALEALTDEFFERCRWTKDR